MDSAVVIVVVVVVAVVLAKDLWAMDENPETGEQQAAAKKRERIEQGTNFMTAYCCL